MRAACGARSSAKPILKSNRFIASSSEGNSMTRMHDRWLARTAALLTFLILSAPAEAQTAVTFSLDFRALGRHAAWYVALDKGYYKQAGLDVTIIPSQGTAQAIQSVESG